MMPFPSPICSSPREDKKRVVEILRWFLKLLIEATD